MLLTVDKVESHSRGVKSVYEYSVVNNGKIMEMLSKQLYSDSMLAICREIFSNARESCIGINNDVDFIVTLPSKNNPEMKIRDYGCGMSEEFLMNNYSKFGESFKDKTNIYTGCYGLGSKSVWAYSDVFTTTTFYNGIKYIYVNNKSGKNGVPELRKLHEESTTEQNGVEISFAVKTQDINSFAQKTAEILQYFPQKFKVIDETNQFDNILNGLNTTPLYQGNGWRICNQSGKAYALMGYIAYPIDQHQITSSNQQLLGCNIIIDFNIGDIGINLGREELEYNETTKKAIAKKLEEISLELKTIIESNIADCECLFDARVKYRSSPYFIQKLLNNVNFRGKDITSNYEYLYDYTCRYYYMAYSRVKSYSSNSIPYKEHVTFVINDILKGSKTIIDKLCLDKDNILVIKLDEQDPIEKQNHITKICNIIGIPESRLIFTSVIKASLPKTPRKKNAGGGGYPTLTLEYINNYHYSKKDFWKKTKINLQDGGYYIGCSGQDLLNGENKIIPNVLYNILQYLPELKIVVPTIIGLRPSHIKKILDPNYNGKKWTHICEYIQEQYDKISTIISIQDIEKYFKINNLDYNLKKVFEKIDISDTIDSFKEIVLSPDDIKKVGSFHSLSIELLNSRLYKFNNIVDCNQKDKIFMIPQHFQILELLSHIYNIEPKYIPHIKKIICLLDEDSKKLQTTT
jgi:hypothetical protein